MADQPKSKESVILLESMLFSIQNIDKDLSKVIHAFDEVMNNLYQKNESLLKTQLEESLTQGNRNAGMDTMQFVEKIENLTQHQTQMNQRVSKLNTYLSLVSGDSAIASQKNLTTLNNQIANCYRDQEILLQTMIEQLKALTIGAPLAANVDPQLVTKALQAAENTLSELNEANHQIKKTMLDQRKGLTQEQSETKSNLTQESTSTDRKHRSK